MSKELIQSLKNNMPAVSGGLDEDTKAVAGGMGSKRISIKGGVFRKMVGGKQVSAVEGRKMPVILVKMAHTASRTWYAQGYKEGERVAPTCWSSDARVPDEAVKNKRAESCDKCPLSIKGSGPDGMGTACRIAWRTAVVLPNDPAGDVMQLVLPATSAFGKEQNGRWPFRPYIQMLASNNISAGRVVTQMEFDIESPVPKLLFSPIGVVPEDVLPIIQQQAATPAALNAVKLTVYQQDEGVEPAAPAPAAPAATVEDEEDEEEAEVPEPKLRERKRAEPSAAAESDVPAALKKWGKKKD